MFTLHSRLSGCRLHLSTRLASDDAYTSFLTLHASTLLLNSRPLPWHPLMLTSLPNSFVCIPPSRAYLLRAAYTMLYSPSTPSFCPSGLGRGLLNLPRLRTPSCLVWLPRDVYFVLSYSCQHYQRYRLLSGPRSTTTPLLGVRCFGPGVYPFSDHVYYIYT